MALFNRTEKGRITKILIEAAANVTEAVAEPFREPLDGDETEWIAKLFNVELDYHNGNLTWDEFEDKVKELDG